MSGGADATVYLVRHAKAGPRDAWTEADELRPLTKKGREQAEGLVGVFRGLPIARIASSPHVRCVQTVRPLALDRQLPLELCDELQEGTPTERAMAFLERNGETNAVFCSHGDVVPALVLALVDAGMAIDGERDWKKGSTWVLERRGGRFARATYVPPPASGGDGPDRRRMRGRRSGGG
jgi:broad specificity phosphatase PhoE